MKDLFVILYTLHYVLLVLYFTNSLHLNNEGLKRNLRYRFMFLVAKDDYIIILYG